jgi:hypothetical protein
MGGVTPYLKTVLTVGKLLPVIGYGERRKRQPRDEIFPHLKTSDK